MSVDPTFGPLMMFGAGGTAVEVIADTSLALPPLDLELARDLIGRTRIARLLAGYRDRKPARISAIAEALVHLSCARLPTIPRSERSTSTRCSPTCKASSRSMRA